jgi:predicted CopG family antitoxin
MENGLYRVKALLEGTGSIPVYITLDAYRHILKEKERLNCSVSDAIVKIIQEQTEKLTQRAGKDNQVHAQTQVAEASH